MRILKKSNDPILNRAQSLEPDWFPLSEVGVSYFQQRGLFYAGLLVMIFVLSAPTIIFALDPIVALKHAVDELGEVKIALTVLICLCFIPVIHELLHIMAHPDFGQSKATIVGGSWLRLFVIYDGAMTQSRMFFYLMMPFIGILVLLSIVLVVMPLLWPIWTVFIGQHLAMCVNDLYMTWKFLRVPRPIKEVWNCGTTFMAR